MKRSIETILISVPQGDAQLLKDNRVNPKSHNENLNHIGRKVELNQPLPSNDSGLHSVDTGSSLSQLEKLMAERLGGSSALGAKPKTGIFQISEPASDLNFTPLIKNSGGHMNKSEIPSSSRPVYSPSKQTGFFRKKIPVGGVSKANYRYIYLMPPVLFCFNANYFVLQAYDRKALWTP